MSRVGNHRFQFPLLSAKKTDWVDGSLLSKLLFPMASCLSLQVHLVKAKQGSAAGCLTAGFWIHLGANVHNVPSMTRSNVLCAVLSYDSYSVAFS
mmetsp:Transcript_152739/g.266768  ORF Transcript_152739/g.266768 Transcript_152739/m.266768 type:complete len:95 (+) Transcript_152739:755-1039(+)